METDTEDLEVILLTEELDAEVRSTQSLIPEPTEFDEVLRKRIKNVISRNKSSLPSLKELKKFFTPLPPQASDLEAFSSDFPSLVRQRYSPPSDQQIEREVEEEFEKWQVFERDNPCVDEKENNISKVNYTVKMDGCESVSEPKFYADIIQNVSQNQTVNFEVNNNKIDMEFTAEILGKNMIDNVPQTEAKPSRPTRLLHTKQEFSRKRQRKSAKF